MDPDKVKAIKEWPTLKNVTEIRAFLGYTNFYRSMIEGYGRYVKPLIDLTKKNEKFRWEEAQQKAFQSIKDKATSEPVVAIPDPEKQFEVEVDASQDVASGCLLQKDEKGRLRLIACFAHKFDDTERRYSTPDKELMAIVLACKQ